MDLQLTHEIAAPRERVEAALLGRQVLARLPAFAPVIREARELSRSGEGGALLRVALYRAAFVPAPLAALIPSAWATWIERTRWDLRAHAADFVVEPQIPPALRRRVVCRGCYALLDAGPARTRRTIAGELRIDAPVVGRRAERILARVVAQQFAGEAALLEQLARGPA